MLFTDPTYFIFFVFIAVIFFSIPKSASMLVLTLGSYLFYAGWNYAFLPLILMSTAIDYWCAWKIYCTHDRQVKKTFLLISVVSNLSILGFFKYYNFFIGLLNSGIGLSMPTLNIILPVGISFFTFQSMSYTIDIYRGIIEREKNFINFACYVSFFPQLVAGPIVRASHFLPQLAKINNRPCINNLLKGSQKFVFGLILKNFADILSLRVVDNVFMDPAQYNSSTCIFAIFCFSIQIYFDFAGYTNMAIGSAKILGFDIPVNFNYPYLSRSLTEFWRRWHISLSTWLRDYLYIPLGGGRGRKYRNVMITMVLGGLWHGANLTFILWGCYHGLILIIERMIGLENKTCNIIFKIFYYFIVMGFVCFGWMLFRVDNLNMAGVFINKIFHINQTVNKSIILDSTVYIAIIVFFLNNIFGLLKENYKTIYEFLCQIWHENWFLRAAIYTISLFYMIVFVPKGANPFIYFQF